MNIKYISLLSLFCAVAANAAKLPVTKRFDQKREKLDECLKSTWGLVPMGCYFKTKAFEQTKEEFLEPHLTKKKELFKSYKRFKEWEKYVGSRMPDRWDKKAFDKNRREESLQIMGHERLIIALNEKNGYDFLADNNKPIVEFSNEIIDEIYCINSNIVQDHYAYRRILQDADESEIAAAREKVKQMIQQQAQQPE